MPEVKRYRGWRIIREPEGPNGPRFRALRFGVGLCNNSIVALVKMIDVRIADEKTRGILASNRTEDRC